jgi:hypothetical protein
MKACGADDFEIPSSTEREPRARERETRRERRTEMFLFLLDGVSTENKWIKNIT